MGLEPIKQPQGGVDAGLFNLPPGFDSKKYAAEWVEEGQVMFKKQRQSIPETGMSADGWDVYKHTTDESKTGKRYTVVNSKNKTFVLMVRPRQVQDDVNALCGNVSKKRIQREIKGETVAGNAPADSGILPEHRLGGADGGSFEAGGGDTDFNKISQEEPSAVMST